MKEKLEVFQVDEGFVAVSSDEVKKGEWYLSLTDDESYMQIFKAKRDLKEYEDEDDCYKKVIATDSSFKLEDYPQFGLPSQNSNIEDLANLLYDKWADGPGLKNVRYMTKDLFLLALQDESLENFFKSDGKAKQLISIEYDGFSKFDLFPDGLLTITNCQFK